MYSDPRKLTAEEHRQAARECVTRADDSWERSDTDGFLSQWANGLTAREHELAAQLAERGWVDEFPGLFTLDGRRVAAKIIDGKFGPCWMMLDEHGRATGVFVSAFVSEKTMARKGYRETLESAPATTKMIGGSAPYPAAVRTDGGYPKDAPDLVYVRKTA